MSFSYGTSYDIVFTGTNMAQPVFESVTAGTIQVKYGVEEAAKAFDMLNWRSLMAMRGMIFGLQMGTFYLSMFASRTLMADSALLSLEDAQDRHNRTIREYGRGSQEAISSMRSLERAQNAYQRQAMVSNILTVSMGLQVVSMGISFLQAAPHIMKAVSALQTYNMVATISKALSGPAGWALLAGGVAAGAIGTYAITQMMQPAQTKTDVEVNIIDEDIVRQYMRRTGGNAIKIGG